LYVVAFSVHRTGDPTSPLVTSDPRRVGKTGRLTRTRRWTEKLGMGTIVGGEGELWGKWVRGSTLADEWGGWGTKPTSNGIPGRLLFKTRGGPAGTHPRGDRDTPPRVLKDFKTRRPSLGPGRRQWILLSPPHAITPKCVSNVCSNPQPTLAPVDEVLLSLSPLCPGQLQMLICNDPSGTLRAGRYGGRLLDKRGRG